MTQRVSAGHQRQGSQGAERLAVRPGVEAPGALGKAEGRLGPGLEEVSVRDNSDEGQR